MKVFISALLLLFATLVQAAELKLATFNAEFLTRPKVHVKFGVRLDMSDLTPQQRQQWDQAAYRNGKFAEAAAAVATVIAAINADVIALTEVGTEQDVAELRAAVAALGVAYNHMAVCECTDNQTQQHVAILSKHPLADVQKSIPGRKTYLTELDDPEAEDETGISKGIVATFSAANQTFHLYVIHLVSEREGFEKDQQRIAQASIVRRHYLQKLSMGGHVIVAGDLNAHRGQPALRRIQGHDDIGPDLIQTGNRDFFDLAERGSRWTYEYDGVRTQIDHILLSSSIKAAARRTNGIKTRVPDQTNPRASDHRPVVVTLDFP